MDYSICDELKLWDQKLYLNEPDQHFTRSAGHTVGDEKATNDLKELGLSPCAFDIITSVTGYFGPRLTSYFLGSVENPIYFKLIKEALKSALDEIQPYSEQVIFRNEDYNNTGVIEWFETRIGETVQFPSFLSCSKEKFSNKDLFYNITTSKNSYARDLMPVLMILDSPKALSEKEVMIKLGAHFIIKKTNGVDEIFLEEVEQNNKDAIMLRNNFWKPNNVNTEVPPERPLTRAEIRIMKEQIDRAQLD